MTTRFARCFPIGNGKMACEHHNGNWIVFPMSEDYGDEKTSQEEVVFEEETE